MYMASHNIEEIGGESKSRYSEKLKRVDLDLRPYQIPADSWKMIQQNGQH